MGVKDIAKDFGILPTFMAKVSQNLPGKYLKIELYTKHIYILGSGGHMHVNLADSHGKNLFYNEKDSDQMSTLFNHFLAGQLYLLPQMMPMFAPTVNSYKRLVAGYWAPTKPTWAVENRTSSYRVIPGGKSTRLEVRVCGADANPYLALSASLASGLYGIKHKLELPPQTKGNAYDEEKKEGAVNLGNLPRNLWEATKAMKESKAARELFGDVFVDHFTATREWEWRQFQNAVTNWETERYMEII